MRRYEKASTILTSNRPIEDWGKVLGDIAAVTAMVAHGRKGSAGSARDCQVLS
jgi:hypothetical protein